MAAWSPTSEKDWAGRFGFVAVPLFGKQRPSDQPGEHFVLLDGQRSSLIFSRGDAQSLLKLRRPIEWAWSANVRGSILVDEKTKTIRRVNWDRPEDIRERRASAVDELLEDVETPPPPSMERSIDRAIRVFRSVRQDIRERGGRDLDAIHAFTVLLLLADSMRQGPIPNEQKMLGGAAAALVRQERLWIQPDTLSPKVSSLLIGDLADQLLSSDGCYSLDPYLLIRHASGTLLEEAHRELAERWQTPRLFPELRIEPPRPQGKARSDIHNTPTTLARFLTEQAVMEFRRLNPRAGSVRVLDPAVGSGVFIVEAIRTLESTRLAMTITGIDLSSLSAAMARFAVNSALRDSIASVKTTHIHIINDDSLARDWGDPDIILMNPPFLPWRRIDSKTRSAIKGTLGDLFHGQADTAIAFMAKAVRVLKPGGVLATVMPAALLGSKSASKLRSVLSGPEWRTVILGRGRGYGYFADATVEPAFIVVSRSAERPCCIRTVIAESSDAVDRAIRAVRREAPNTDVEGSDWELGTRDTLNAKDWTPRPSRAKRLLCQFAQSTTVRTVSDLFDVHLGIRIGDKKALIVPPSLVERMSPEERKFFRPLADNIKRGRIQSPQFVFYPYDNKRLSIPTEAQLRTLVPEFYSTCLAPNESKLRGRRSRRSRQWWELVEPRLSWLSFGGPRIVSTAFGHRGAFAFDARGEYAVVQGNAWLWKGSRDLSIEEWFGYLAVLNSPIFEAVIDYFSWQTQGGQYELAKRFVGNAPLPDMTLLAKREKKRLAEHGRDIHEGKRLPLYSHSTATAAAFGVQLEDLIAAFPLLPSARLEMDFEQLASKWKRETAGFSSDAQKMRHSSVQSILKMGEAAVPLILRDLQNRPAWWFGVLRTLTGADPVPMNKRGLLDESAAAWIAWGKKNGYEL